MNKVYSLPDLPSAPYSDAQALLRRFLEYRDFSALRPLLDELEALGEKEARRSLFNICLSAVIGTWWRWDNLVHHILDDCGHLVYSTEAVVEGLSKKDWSENYWQNTLAVVSPEEAASYPQQDNQ